MNRLPKLFTTAPKEVYPLFAAVSVGLAAGVVTSYSMLTRSDTDVLVNKDREANKHYWDNVPVPNPIPVQRVSRNPLSRNNTR